MDASEMERLMGFAPGELERTADAYESDNWPPGTTDARGRTPLGSETAFIAACADVSAAAAFEATARPAPNGSERS